MFSLSINTVVVTEAANKVTVKIKGLDICKAITVFIIFGAALKLLLITALFPKPENVGHKALLQPLIIFINNHVHSHPDDDFHIYMLH